jgi:flagella basal body P-ring formation protein FlgA
MGVDQKKTDKTSGPGAEEKSQRGPVIFAGDRLVVEEHTARADAVLEARALSSAAPGAAFNARLTVGGRVVRAVALGPGHAALQPETGAGR